MKNWAGLGFWLGITLALVQACGSSGSSGGSSAAGAAGVAGTGGATGTAGTSSAGSAGTSASTAGSSASSAGAPAESGGTAGASVGGTSASAGEAGAAGQGGAGCPAGFADCDGDPSNGCEQSLSDVLHCGACTHACVSKNGAVGCDQGTCKVSACAATFADCDGSGDNGCEVSLTSDTNCGSCGRNCTIDGAACSAGLCGTVQLFSATDMPFGTDNAAARSWAFDPTTAAAFWLGFNSYSVRRYPFDGSAATLVWQPNPANVTGGTESIAVTGGHIYWSVGGTPATVFSKAVGAAASVTPTQAFFPAARASFLRVLGSSFYWVTGDYQDPSAPAKGNVYARLISAPSSDPGTAIVTADQGNFGDFKAFQPTSNALYWVADKGTVPLELRTTPLAGGTPTAVPKIAGAADTAITDAAGALYTPTSLYAVGATIYFSRFIGTSPINGIYRYTTGDSAPTQLVIADGVKSMLVDSSSIYYLSNATNQVFKAPIAGGAATPVTNATGYKLIGQDSTYLYLLQSGCCGSTLAKVIK